MHINYKVTYSFETIVAGAVEAEVPVGRDLCPQRNLLRPSSLGGRLACSGRFLPTLLAIQFVNRSQNLPFFQPSLCLDKSVSVSVSVNLSLSAWGERGRNEMYLSRFPVQRGPEIVELPLGTIWVQHAPIPHAVSPVAMLVTRV